MAPHCHTQQRPSPELATRLAEKPRKQGEAKGHAHALSPKAKCPRLSFQSNPKADSIAIDTLYNTPSTASHQPGEIGHNDRTTVSQHGARAGRTTMDSSTTAAALAAAAPAPADAAATTAAEAEAGPPEGSSDAHTWLAGFRAARRKASAAAVGGSGGAGAAGEIEESGVAAEDKGEDEEEEGEALEEERLKAVAAAAALLRVGVLVGGGVGAWCVI